jgi:hypothetical protein
MRSPVRPGLALSLAVVLFAAACGDGGADEGGDAGEVADGTASDGAEDGDADASDGEDVARDVPAEWQELTFTGGAFATPADWAETDPIGEDELTVLGPDVDDGLPFAARVRTTERDEVPFQELPQLLGTTLVLQLDDVEPVAEDPIEVPGAEEALVATFRYEEPVDGETVTVEERVLIAWFAGDRQLQLRIGGPVDLLEAEGGTIDDVLGTVVLDEG